MTEQEAIQGIKNEMECVLSEHSTSYFDECLEVAYASMEKQIAKKVLIKHHEKTPWTREISQYLCPCCDRVIGFNGQIHCSTCGQKLLYDWGNEDAE